MPNESYRLVLICKGCAWWDSKPVKNSTKHKCTYFKEYYSNEDGFCDNAVPREEVHKE